MDAAEKRSGPADHMSVSVGEAEYPCVTRLRHRRLIAFLRDQGFHDSYNELTDRTRAHMSLRHLRGLVERGRWLAAVEYLDRYLPPPTIRRSYHAQVLRNFLVTHHRFADAVDGIVDKTLPRHYLQLNNGRAISHADLRLQSIAFSILLTVDELRANMNWERVRERAWTVVNRLAPSTPELRGCIALPATSIRPHHVLPIASGLWSRRRYVKKKQTGRPEAIVRAMKSQQLTVPRIGSLEEAKELLADVLDESLRYGVQLSTSGLNHSLQSGTNEGAQFCQPMFGTSTEAKSSGTLANAGTNQHVVEAGCHTNTAYEESIVCKIERDLKRQRLMASLGKATPFVWGPGAVMNSDANVSNVSSR